ncbi:MAG TPA: tRNA lysidine(34) synthetase TilS [Noviherbaspirillum sp.]|uniref:tRNA lysidine(34) synthetase TilS n=1 Tax=Noviherbaspirillum sp. TaxID=1926288 RepID=UPI002D590789|nr:tRNA lysidine(34) synthetase TilS [Noviherbaspirillum sp.]HYD96927.1 tRNA lysidine(34) synthetase TilS [Noviherbaspirillum sp.]
MTTGQAASVPDAFERALGEIRARVSVSAPCIAIAYSGGLDSSALLHLAHAWARRQGVELFAFHVHHGLSLNAGRWLALCERTCGALGVRFDARRVQVETCGDGIEQAARTARYAALGDLCREYNVPLLLTAHHQDDQVETVLLQLLRGAGVVGLSGMSPFNEAQRLLGGPLPVLGRPLLELARADLERYVAQHRIAHVEDESNADIRFARNALRHEILPSLAVHFPGFEQRIVRSAGHFRAAQRLLDELAAADLSACAVGDSIDLDRLRQLNEDRMENLLRHWFARHRVRLPATAWLAQMRVQLLAAREDAQVCIVHPDCEIRRHRNRIHLIARSPDAITCAEPITFRWQGEQSISFPAFGGSLHFESAEEGIEAGWLRRQDLQIRYRSGGEKLKRAPDRPTRSLKHHYQELDIPAWERRRLPVVLASARLVFAAGIGMNWKDVPTNACPFVRLRWEKDIAT